MLVSPLLTDKTVFKSVSNQPHQFLPTAVCRDVSKLASIAKQCCVDVTVLGPDYKAVLTTRALGLVTLGT